MVNNLKLMDFVDSVLFGYNILFHTKGRVPKKYKKRTFVIYTRGKGGWVIKCTFQIFKENIKNHSLNSKTWSTLGVYMNMAE